MPPAFLPEFRRRFAQVPDTGKANCVLHTNDEVLFIAGLTLACGIGCQAGL